MSTNSARLAYSGVFACAGKGQEAGQIAADLDSEHTVLRDQADGLDHGAHTIATLGFFLLLLLSAPTLVLMIAFALLAGVSDAITDTSYNSSLQRIPRKNRGKVVGIAYFWERIGMGMGVLPEGLPESFAARSIRVLISHLAMNYRPQALFTGRVVELRARNSGLWRVAEESAGADRAAGWAAHCACAPEVHFVAGDHDSLLATRRSARPPPF